MRRAAIDQLPSPGEGQGWRLGTSASWFAGNVGLISGADILVALRSRRLRWTDRRLGYNARMVEITATYEGQLHCTATHGPSGATLATDAPKDNMGKGEAF